MAADRRVLVEGRYLRFVVVDGWEFVERNKSSGVVVVVAVTPEDHLLLVEQYRPALARRVVELPAGIAGDVAGHEAEDLATAARRELLEETGYEAESLVPLGAPGPASSGVSSEVITFFRARGLRRVGAGGGDGTEQIELHSVPLGSAAAWLMERARSGRLVDPKVYAGLYFLNEG
jgi:ADP-ribose pyrophosphatase